MLCAAIDIGSNTTRVLVAEPVDGGFYTQVYLGGSESFIELEQLSPRLTAEDGATFSIALSAERRPAAK